jgi:hypothetical protein
MVPLRAAVRWRALYEAPMITGSSRERRRVSPRGTLGYRDASRDDVGVLHRYHRFDGASRFWDVPRVSDS